MTLKQIVDLVESTLGIKIGPGGKLAYYCAILIMVQEGHKHKNITLFFHKRSISAITLMHLKVQDLLYTDKELKRAYLACNKRLTDIEDNDTQSYAEAS
jgi:hypothetical protein